MATFSEITSTIQKAVANGGFTYPIQYEGMALNHNNAPYLRLTVLPNVMRHATLGADGCDYHHGIIQIDIFYPLNKGITTMVQEADSIGSYFYSSRVFTSTNLNVRIDKTNIGPRLPKDGWIMQPVSIYYYSYATREIPN